MNSKYIYGFLTCLALTLMVACNNSDSEYTIPPASHNSEIKSFSVSAKPYTDEDKITYPILKATKFTILNQGESASQIFNRKPLPINIDIRGLKVEVGFSGTPLRVELLYDEGEVKEWNTIDSVQFKYSNDGRFYPQIKVYPPSGEYPRVYHIDFRIYKEDTEGITWESMNNFSLPVAEKSKTLISTDKNTFFTLIHDGGNLNLAKATVNNNPTWESPATTNLPANAVVNSFLNTDDKFIVIDEDGVVYTSPITDGATWNTLGSTTVLSIVGMLPNLKPLPGSQILFTYLENNIVKFAKTEDFTTITNLENSDSNLSVFPIKDYSTAMYSDSHEDFLVITGGDDINNNLVDKSWSIKNASETKINLSLSGSLYPLPIKDAVTTFTYDNQIYAFSSDNLSMYYSQDGGTWKIGSEGQKLNEEMKTMNKPSIVVDKDNYIWVFGGISNKLIPQYSDKVWRGRLNRLATE